MRFQLKNGATSCSPLWEPLVHEERYCPSLFLDRYVDPKVAKFLVEIVHPFMRTATMTLARGWFLCYGRALYASLIRDFSSDHGKTAIVGFPSALVISNGICSRIAAKRASADAKVLFSG